MHYLVLGAGPAGVTAAETLRKHDKTAKITLLGGEPEPPYSRMAIPYYLIEKVGEDGTYLRQQDNHYENLNIDYVHGVAVALHGKSKRLKLEDGSEIQFDKLLICTGASPITPPIPGLDRDGIYNCWTLEDARHIARLAQKGEPVVLMGAGFIGSIILESLALKGVNLTVVEMGDRMVPRMLDETAGVMLQQWCESKGVRVLTSTMISEVGDGPEGLTVHTKGGEALDAKLLVVAAGVQPNIGFLASSGVTIEHGILVDQYMRTSVPDVYAAGDVCQAIDFSTQKAEMLAIQPVAVEHGRIAAQNMTGKATPHEGSLNMNVLESMGLITASFGLWMGVEGGDSAKMVDLPNNRYLRLEFDGNKLVGGQAVGLTEHVGILRGLIQTELDLGPWKDKLMKEPQRLPEAYVAVAQGIV
ncbi:MAG: NADH oxidase [Methyloligella sp.]|nr:MAG: NADH oxidase [Methyloligella sp.]